MSMAALRWARSVRGISSTQKLVLWALADSANDYGEAWPSALLLAEDCCLTDRAVRDALDALERIQLITGQRATGRATRWVVEVGSTPEARSASPEPPSGTSEPHSGVASSTTGEADPGTWFRPTPEHGSDHPGTWFRQNPKEPP
jgi:pyocin large subunit-like protein